MKENIEIRASISNAGLKYWEVAYATGISEATLCVWLRKPLSTERRERINAAIEKLCSQRRQENAGI